LFWSYEALPLIGFLRCIYTFERRKHGSFVNTTLLACKETVMTRTGPSKMTRKIPKGLTAFLPDPEATTLLITISLFRDIPSRT
jgi:hypothetical protein